MALSHIGSKGPDRCTASVLENCPFYNKDGYENHFRTMKEAREEYERRMDDRIFTNKLNKKMMTLKFSENKSPLTSFNYARKMNIEGKINPKIINNDSWKEFGFSGPNILKMKATNNELKFYNQASVQEISVLSDREKEALQFFTSSSFADFNKYVFNATSIDKEKQAVFNNIKETLDNALNKSPKISKIVYRGVKTSASVIGINEDDDYGKRMEKLNNYVNNNFKLGSKVAFSGYQSTALDPSVATSWAERDGIVFEIMSPNGVNLTSISRNPEETEVLMPRNTKYMVIGVQKGDDLPFSYRAKPSHIIQLVAIDDDNNVL